MSTSELAAAPAVAPTPLKVEPLVCGQCDGPVPIVDEAETTCPYCRSVVAIPPEHHALRQATHASEADLAEAQAQYAKLGAPPGPLLRAWSGAADGALSFLGAALRVFLKIWVGLLQIVFEALKNIDDLRILLVVLALPLIALYGVLWATGMALRLMAPVFGVDVIDRLTITGGFLVLGCVLYVLFPIPIALRNYADAWAGVRRRLQTCLAARPPRVAGGPALCRRCGAALVVPQRALGVRCVYCQADNLVAMPARWVADVERASADLHEQVSTALEEEAETRRSARRGAVGLLGITLLLPGLTAGLGAAMGKFGHFEHRPGFVEELAGVRALLPHECGEPRDALCQPSRDVALRRGETLVIVHREDARPDPLSMRRLGLGGGAPLRFAGGDVGGGTSVYRASFTAPVTGWYVLSPLATDDVEWQLLDPHGRRLQQHGGPDAAP